MPLGNIAADYMTVCVALENPGEIRMIHIEFAVDDGDRDALAPVSARPARGIGTDKAECV